jgi:hypothetical protein
VNENTDLNVSPFIWLGRGLELYKDIWVVHHDCVLTRQLNALVPVIACDGILVLILQQVTKADDSISNKISLQKHCQV